MIRKFIREYWLILVICIFGFAFRIYNLENLFYFTYDEEVPAFVGRRLALFQHVPLIGGVTPFGFHLTPYFYWLLGGLLWLGGLNPIIWGVAGAFFAIPTIFLIYLVGQELGGKKVGFVASLIWSFSYLVNVYDRHFWALYWGPLLSLTIFFCLLKIIKGKSFRHIYLLSVCLIWCIATDPSNIALMIVAMVVWAIYKLPINRHFLVGIVVVLVSLLPLIVFDLRHEFANSKPVINFLQNKGDAYAPSVGNLSEGFTVYPVSFTRLIYAFGNNDIAKEYSYCASFISERFDAIPPFLILFSSAILLGFLIWSILAPRKNLWKLVGVQLVVYFIGLGIYGVLLNGPLFEHYISGLFPSFVLITALILSKAKKEILVIILAIVIGLNIFKVYSSQNSTGLKNKMSAVRFATEQVNGKSFFLDALPGCWRYSGYRYLFTLTDNIPSGSYVDSSLGYLYEDQITEGKPERVVVFISHSKYEQEAISEFLSKTQEKLIGRRRFGDIEVVILDNSDDRYGKL